MFFESIKSRNELAISDTRKSRSWEELEHQAACFREFLVNEKQLKENQHIAVLIGNKLEFFEVLLASLASGLWFTPINTHLSRGEILFILENSGASLFLYDDEHKDILKNELPCEAFSVEQLSEAFLGSFENDNQKKLIPENAPSGGTMIYTSGTTGKPKGVKRNKPALLKDTLLTMRAGAEGIGLKGNGPHLITGPLYHAGPLLFAFYDMLVGAPVIIMSKWDTGRFIELVNEYQIKTTHLVPTMFVRLLHLNEEKPVDMKQLASLELVLHGAAPIAPSIKHKMIAWWGPILLEYWGASEAGTSTLVNSEDWLKHPGTVGKPLPHLEMFIGDEAGNPVEEKEGLLFCKNKNLKQVFEYHGDPEKTKSAHPKDHVFCIGDIGRIDEEGFVYLSDRKSNMIISGGVNIYPAEIEQALIEHPAIADLAVFGVPDDEWGESVKALVEVRGEIENKEMLIEDLKAFAREKIAGYKVPRYIEFIDTLPRNAAGKVRNEVLKEFGKN